MTDIAIRVEHLSKRLRQAFRAPDTPWLAGILIVALALRLWGIGFGLPYEYHIDEVQYVRQAASMGADGLEPVWWNNPPFYKYLLLIEYGALYGVGRILGWYASVSDFASQHMLDPTRLYLLARTTTALFGALTVALVYWLGRLAYNSATGLLSAGFLAICFLHVRDSHFAVNDVPVTFFTTLVLLAAVQIARSGRKLWYWVAGAALGVGFATKYSAALSILPICIAHLYSPDVALRCGQLALRRLWLVLAVAAASAVVASPYFIITPGNVIRDAYEALYLAGRYGFEGWQIDPAGGYLFYLKTLAWGMGWLLLGSAGLAIIVALLRRLPQDVILAGYVSVLYLLLGRQRMFFARFALPLIPPLLVLAASFVEKAILSFVPDLRRVRWALALGSLVIAGQPLLQVVRFDYLLTQTDTRTQAKLWIEAAVPEGSRIAVDWRTYGPPLSTPDQPASSSLHQYDVTIVGGKGLSEHSLTWYREHGFDYLVVSSFISEIALVDPAQHALRKTFYAGLHQELRLLQTFSPSDNHAAPAFIFDEVYAPAIDLWQRERPGPTLSVYRIQP